MTNIPSFQVRIDSEKHVEIDLERRLFAAMTHWTEEESLSARRVQTRHDSLRRRRGDMTQPFGSDQVV